MKRNNKRKINSADGHCNALKPTADSLPFYEGFSTISLAASHLQGSPR